MSTKQAQFAKVLGNPQNTHNFIIRAGKLLEGLEVLVQAASFPTEKMREYTLHYLGETILYPAMPETSGKWNCQIPESESALVFKKAVEQKGAIWQQHSGLLIPVIKTEIEVVSRDLQDVELYSVTLHGCWIVGKEPVAMSNATQTTNWVWDISFNYDWQEDNIIKK